MSWHSKLLSAADGLEVVAWDLDSTVRTTMHRRWMLPEIKSGLLTWDDYSMACAGDSPNPGAVALMRMLGGRYLNIAISGCSEAALDLTVGWAARHRVPLDDYILRPAGDSTPNGEWKVTGVRRLQDAGLVVRVFLEDWGPAAAYITEHTGVPVFGVNPFDPDTVMITQEQLAAALAAHSAYGNADWVEPRDLAADIFGKLPGKVSI